MSENAAATTPAGGDDGIRINGVLYTPDDLTFREQKSVRKTVLELAGSEDDATVADVTAAFAFVVLNRDHDVPLDEVLDMKPADLAGPPTKPAPARTASARSSRAKASGATGRRK